MQDRIIPLLFVLPVLLFSLCVHEWAHAWVAFRRGDPTPVRAGRLSILPWAHWDLIGTILLPAACFLSGMPAFGWAKPVPVDARYFHRPRLDMALVAIAGPLSNIVLAVAGAFSLSVLHSVLLQTADLSPWQAPLEVGKTMLIVGVQANLALAFFNLLPFPPLDGSVILQSMLPIRVIVWMQRLAPLSIVLVAALYFSGGLSFLSVLIHRSFLLLMNWMLL